jgi:uncharacterized membrane protein YhiD involved in acid resistance
MRQGFVYKIFFWAIAGIAFFLFLGNVRNWWQFKKLKTEEKQFRVQIEEKEEKTRKLSELISYAKTEEFIKSELRRNLSLGEKNETIIITPNLSILSEGKEDKPKVVVPAWKAWYLLLAKKE